ncbi:thermonuclease family protein [Primorskyibacter flagellatus]|uniref:Nuclease homologue n=1 Tax=Primorskyibacter flagellatus TaxID=1387277 RepID=A0A1W2DXX2_9RHOB|nr:thermonuclease family protein [Primorskyibacter flagellatus]SMD02390.1 nuclease homologue [Primorskyibacter flagellatus]
MRLLLILALLWPAIATAEVIASSSIYVVDGDTVRAKGDKFRLVGFDTPETYKPRCEYELALGRAATNRLRQLMASVRNVDLVILPGRDKYNRGLARLYVGRNDVADILVSEGLARRYNGGRRQSWCG